VTLVLDSQPGDYVGEGRRRTFTSADGVFQFYRNSKNGVSLSFATPTRTSWWYLDFAGPDNQPLTVGTYRGATRYSYQLPGGAGIEIDGIGHTCQSLTGSFEVRQITYGVNNTIESFSAAFEQHCEDAAPALFGEIRLNPYVTLTAPPAQTAKIGENLTFTVRARAINGRPLVLAAPNLPAGAIFTDRGDNEGTFTWTPTEAQRGLFHVRFEARSDLGDVDSAVTRITATDNVIDFDHLTAPSCSRPSRVTHGHTDTMGQRNAWP
jgi:hypothetical protein